MDVSFGTVWEAFARELPDAIAISEPGRDYSYAEFEERSARQIGRASCRERVYGLV